MQGGMAWHDHDMYFTRIARFFLRLVEAHVCAKLLTLSRPLRL